MKRLLVAVSAVVLLLVMLVPAVSAGLIWCEWDPLVKVTTPQGTIVDVHVTLYGAGAGNQAALEAADISYEVKPVANGARTEVTISVLIPAQSEEFKARSVVSTEENAQGTILDISNGHSGKVMKLKFQIDVP